jgi:hypothetical protein
VSESDRKSDSEVGSNERTNERTDASDHHGCKSGTGSRRERAYDEFDGLVAVGSVIAAGELWQTSERHERTRIGERDEIPRHVRAAVWFRDSGKCADCHPEYPSGDVLHLDHIKPWSAGGADTTDNLRLLCERHNLKRSNYIDFARPKRPATWWCANCYTLDEHVWTYYRAGFVTCPVHGNSMNPAKSRCRVERAHARAYRDGEDMPTWHMRPMLTAFDQIAYCAHCDAPGMTGVLL